MSITREQKQELIQQYKTSEGDTGSPSVQCAILTKRINNLIGHFKENKKDHHSRRGLIMLVEKRKKLLKYLQKNNQNSYLELIKRLNLRK